MSGFVKNIVSKSANYSVLATDDTILANATGSAFMVTLTISGIPTGKVYTVKKTDSSANGVTLSPVSGMINGKASFVVAEQNETIDVQFDGTNYWIV
jgi:hypothetical protein